MISWVKSELRVEAKESRWSFCTGMALYDCQKYDAALLKFREVLELNTDYWKARQFIAISLAFKNNYEEAVRTMNDLVETQSCRLDIDTEYHHEYWNHILPTIADWNSRLENYAAAQEASQKLVTKAMERKLMDADSREDLKQYMFIFLKQRKHSEIVQLLEDLASRTDQGVNWLIQILNTSYEDDDFHDTLLDVGKNSHYSSRIIEAYQAAIDEAQRPESMVPEEIKHPLMAKLRTMLSRLKWYLAGTMELRHAAIAVWEEILLEELHDDSIHFQTVIWTRRAAVNLVGPALVTAAKEESSGTLDIEVAEKYLKRLEALQEIDHATGSYLVTDVRIPLARLLYLMNRPERARNVIRGYVSLAVQILEESKGDNEDACERLINAFLVLGDDTNALAAFTLSSRKRSSETSAGTDASAEHFADNSEPRASIPKEEGQASEAVAHISNDVHSTGPDLNAQHNGTANGEPPLIKPQDLETFYTTVATGAETIGDGKANHESSSTVSNALESSLQSVDVLHQMEDDQRAARYLSRPDNETLNVADDGEPIQADSSEDNVQRPPPLLEGWTAHLDGTSGNHYFIHLPSQSTQWEHPNTPNPMNLQASDSKAGAGAQDRSGDAVPASMTLAPLATDAGSHSPLKNDTPAPERPASSETGLYMLLHSLQL